MKIKQAGDIFYGRFSIFEDKAGFEAAVSCRKGGSSPAPFDTLNMSFSAGDNPEHVRDNRKRFLQLLGIPSDQIISCHQVHGIHLEQVGAEYCGRGALDPDDALPACDGLLTNESNVPLTMNFADCMPLVFYDPVRRAAALSHGGWRGTAGNIAGRTVKRMQEVFGSIPGNILAAEGPAIGPSCFEVGEDVQKAFVCLFQEEQQNCLFRNKGGGKYLFSLAEANRLLMIRAGIRPEHIELSDICTYTRDDLFYSHRHSGGRTGRHMTVVMLK